MSDLRMFQFPYGQISPTIYDPIFESVQIPFSPTANPTNFQPHQREVSTISLCPYVHMCRYLYEPMAPYPNVVFALYMLYVPMYLFLVSCLLMFVSCLRSHVP